MGCDLPVYQRRRLVRDRKVTWEGREREEFEIFCKCLDVFTRGAEIVLRIKLYFQILVRCQGLAWLDYLDG